MKLDKIARLLQTIKKPDIREDKGEDIERDVGDSVTCAYSAGVHDGKRTGRYELAQEILKMINYNGGK